MCTRYIYSFVVYMYTTSLEPMYSIFILLICLIRDSWIADIKIIYIQYIIVYYMLIFNNQINVKYILGNQ